MLTKIILKISNGLWATNQYKWTKFDYFVEINGNSWFAINMLLPVVNYMVYNYSVKPYA